MNPYTYQPRSSGFRKYGRKIFKRRRMVKMVKQIAQRSGEKKFNITNIDWNLGNGDANGSVRICIIPRGPERSSRIGNKVTVVGIYINITLKYVPSQGGPSNIPFRVLCLTNKLNAAVTGIIPGNPQVTLMTSRPDPEGTYVVMDQYGVLAQTNATPFYALKRFIRPRGTSLQFANGANANAPLNKDWSLIVTIGGVGGVNNSRIDVAGYVSVHYYD